MPRYAVIVDGVVENVIVADSQPIIAGRTIVVLMDETVGPGDAYDGVHFAPRQLSASEQRAAAAAARLISGRAQLRQLRDQATTVAAGSGTLTTAQLSNAVRQIAGALATLAQNVMDLELIAAYQSDDGAE